MDYYDDLIRQRGESAALSIIMDDARKLRWRLRFIRLIAAAAAARELCRQGIADPAGNWRFEQGLCAAQMEIWGACSRGLLPGDAVRIIADGADIKKPHKVIEQAGLLANIMSNGFIPPDPCPSEDYERGWEAYCKAIRESHELRLLIEALADMREVLEP